MKLMKIIDKIRDHGPFYSLEFFPPREKESWPSFFATVERLRAMEPLFASVTYGAGGTRQANTLEIPAGRAGMDLTPMAHLTCVGASKTSIREFIVALREADVFNILALRGDPPAGQNIRWEDGEFVYASELVSFVREEFPDMGIGVAAYPAPHPESLSFESDRKFTKTKLDAGSDLAVTQLFFDTREYFELVRLMRSMGSTQPIVPGVLPILSLESMRRVLSLSGCNIPAKLYLSVEEAHNKGGSEAVREAGIAFAVDQIKRLLDGGAPGIHLYTLNKAEMCLRIAEEVGKIR